MKVVAASVATQAFPGAATYCRRHCAGQIIDFPLYATSATEREGSDMLEAPVSVWGTNGGISRCSGGESDCVVLMRSSARFRRRSGCDWPLFHGADKRPAAASVAFAYFRTPHRTGRSDASRDAGVHRRRCGLGSRPADMLLFRHHRPCGTTGEQPWKQPQSPRWSSNNAPAQVSSSFGRSPAA